jgi:hypothetical protein
VDDLPSVTDDFSPRSDSVNPIIVDHDFIYFYGRPIATMLMLHNCEVLQEFKQRLEST